MSKGEKPKYIIETAGCVSALIVVGALFALLFDAYLWTLVYYNPISIWTLILVILTGANLASLGAPFVLESRNRRYSRSHRQNTLIVVAAITLWMVHLFLAYAVWDGLCSACYFG
jgi:cation transport ATPase